MTQALEEKAIDMNELTEFLDTYSMKKLGGLWTLDVPAAVIGALAADLIRYANWRNQRMKPTDCYFIDIDRVFEAARQAALE